MVMMVAVVGGKEKLVRMRTYYSHKIPWHIEAFNAAGGRYTRPGCQMCLMAGLQVPMRVRSNV